MASAERIEVDIVLDDGSIKKAFVNIENSAKQFGDRAGKSLEKGLSSGFGQAASALKNQILGLGAAFLSLQGVSAIGRNFLELEKAFAEIKTIIPDITQANEGLRQSFIDLSGQFGTSASEQAKSFYAIVSAGITDSAKAQDALTAANKLAIGGLTSTEVAIDLLTSSINAYGAENLSAAKASDVLFGAVRLGKTTVGELGSSLGQILPTASSLKVGFEDVAGAVAALTTRGVSTSAAVTQLNAVLTAVLSKQAEAKNLGPDVAKAFSLQALQAKGLTGFLRDLNTSLGGSEQALVKLIGSAEGARAILALSGDGFQTLGNNVAALEDSAGAADAAFNKINQTVGAQTDQIFSKISALFLNLTNASGGAIFSIVSSVNQGLGSLLTNFNQVANTIGTIIQKLIAGFLALRFGPSVFAGISRSIRGLGTELTLIPTRFAFAKLSVQQFSLSLKTAFRNPTAGISKLLVGLKSLNIGLKIVNVSAKLAKASLTLGLALALDFLIEKFLEVKESFGGLGNLFKFTVLTIQRSLNELIVGFVEFIRQIEKLPFIGDKIAGSLGPTFDKIQSDAVGNLNAIEESFDSLADKVASETGIIPTFTQKDPTAGIDTTVDNGGFPEVDQAVLDANREKVERALDAEKKKTSDVRKAQVNIAEEAFKRIANIFSENSFKIQVSQQELEATAVQSFKRIGAAAVEGFARSFEAVGSAIVKGENAFEAFGKAILGVLGDVAIQAGTLYTLLGIASFNPAQVAAGIALTILGGVLKAVAGGGGSSGSASPGGGVSSNPIDGNTSPISAPTQTGQQVAVNIQGDVLDSEDTGLRIAEILKDQGFSNSVVS